ncbi:hypothetical protein [Pseudomonas cremoricolorata]|uniref:hypothetical protein n=1 Tax=Pseudomonas cremoricolorata TaxID=157783 RepID=UPI000419AE8E|nr:hypothetical protein [Pseudomonas cremoricolorata]
MSLTMAIILLIGMWTSVALAMLWGVLRILRRHSPTPTRPAALPRTQRVRLKKAGV